MAERTISSASRYAEEFRILLGESGMHLIWIEKEINLPGHQQIGGRPFVKFRVPGAGFERRIVGGLALRVFDGARFENGKGY
jgi:hypothetical protein